MLQITVFGRQFFIKKVKFNLNSGHIDEDEVERPGSPLMDLDLVFEVLLEVR